MLRLRFIRLAIGGLLLAGLTSSVAAQERDSLPGYENFPFRMTEAEIRGRVYIPNESLETGVGVPQKWLYARYPIEIGGLDFHLSFHLVDGRLHQVKLSNPTYGGSILIRRMDPADVSNDASCGPAFDNARAFLETDFGAPDAAPKRTDMSRTEISVTQTEIAYAYRDGGRISLAETSISGFCTVALTFTSGGEWPN